MPQTSARTMNELERTAASPGQCEWQDRRGNRVLAPAWLVPTDVVFKGEGCLLEVHPLALVGKLEVVFHGSQAQCRLGAVGMSDAKFSAHIRLGHRCRVSVGDHVTTTARSIIAASEGASISIGDDCMFATSVHVRTDDAHPIYDIHTGSRINPAEDVVIGEHVWLAFGARCLAGARIGRGSVIGMNSIVTGRIPNNCVAVGAPARVVRRDIAWERPALSFSDGEGLPDMKRPGPYWEPTVEE
jgi:acetyltransferase-like isoleucine patch superfamily enzyme